MQRTAYQKEKKNCNNNFIFQSTAVYFEVRINKKNQIKKKIKTT